MSDRKQVNVNEAALDWLREHDQPINDAPQPAATECPQCRGEKNNPCFLWTQTTGWGDVECGPKCANIFHNAPTPPASQPTVTLSWETPAIYAASRASVPERPAMWQRLRSEGHNIISSWIDEAMPGATADLSELWTRIVREVTMADRLVLYVEPDDFPLKGALLEVGFAIASGKRVYVVAPGCDFTAPSYRPIGSWIKHPLVTVCDMRLALLRAAEQR